MNFYHYKKKSKNTSQSRLFPKIANPLYRDKKGDSTGKYHWLNKATQEKFQRICYSREEGA